MSQLQELWKTIAHPKWCHCEVCDPKEKSKHEKVSKPRKSSSRGKATEERIAEYQGKKALLDTWESQPEDVQIAEHDYLLRLRAEVRQVRNYILHRADPKANV